VRDKQVSLFPAALFTAMTAMKVMLVVAVFFAATLAVTDRSTRSFGCADMACSRLEGRSGQNTQQQNDSR